MALLNEVHKMKDSENFLEKFQQSPKDTGSAPVQTADLTQKIRKLTEHFKIHKQDFHSQRGLLKLVSRRKKLLSYIKQKNQKTYEKLISQLGLRK